MNVEKTDDTFEASVLAAVERSQDEDYYDEEGFLCCGICHTRKQCEISLPIELYGADRTVRVRIMCECALKKQAAERKEQRRREDMAAILRLRKDSLMDDEFRQAIFDNFRKDKYNARNLKLCLRYAEHFQEMMEKNQGLLFYGGVGTGKTFAAACIANYLLSRRVPVVMTSFIKLLNAMQGFENDNEKLLHQLNRAQLLIIDDLGAERGSEYALEKVYNIIDSRRRAKKPLIITTNLDIAVIRDAADLRYARIYDRIMQVCYPMEFAGVSWRKAEAVKRLKEMERFLEGTE